MKFQKTLVTLTLCATSLFIGKVFAQDQNAMTKYERHVADSVEASAVKEEQVQKNKDEVRMADAKLDRKQTKAKAKEAKRVEREANDAAVQSKNALKSEKKAQKARRQANEQADKASKAREKSDIN